MKYFKIFTIPIAFLFILSGCAGTARIEKDETVDFSKIKTYQWIGNGANSSEPKGLSERNLQAAVSSKLRQADWVEVNSNPDVFIMHDMDVEKKLEERSSPVYSRSFIRQYYHPYRKRWVSVYYPSRFIGYDNDQYEVNEGTITLTMVDAKTDKVIWQAWNTDKVDYKKLTSKEIQSAVNSIFKKFEKSVQ